MMLLGQETNKETWPIIMFGLRLFKINVHEIYIPLFSTCRPTRRLYVSLGCSLKGKLSLGVPDLVTGKSRLFTSVECEGLKPVLVFCLQKFTSQVCIIFNAPFCT
jgi:hypothetical protein